jgi:hypothetical protein
MVIYSVIGIFIKVYHESLRFIMTEFISGLLFGRYCLISMGVVKIGQSKPPLSIIGLYIHTDIVSPDCAVNI